jgi:hypothetical protein
MDLHRDTFTGVVTITLNPQQRHQSRTFLRCHVPLWFTIDLGRTCCPRNAWTEDSPAQKEDKKLVRWTNRWHVGDATGP